MLFWNWFSFNQNTLILWDKDAFGDYVLSKDTTYQQKIDVLIRNIYQIQKDTLMHMLIYFSSLGKLLIQRGRQLCKISGYSWISCIDLKIEKVTDLLKHKLGSASGIFKRIKLLTTLCQFISLCGIITNINEFNCCDFWV